MTEHVLFLTGKLAERSLHRVIAEIQATEFTYEVRQMGISVAALMTADLSHLQYRWVPGKSASLDALNLASVGFRQEHQRQA